ncbi:MAG: hypothetical protein HY431_00680 [Candidatus Levybacteria bacterium]|nr:hypothetical protein [Candidatus Levybacteria bacterium]
MKLTRKEVIKTLNERGVPMTEANLAYLVQNQILPASVRKGLKDSEGAGSEGYYDSSIIDYLMIVQTLHDQGHSYPEIRQKLQTIALKEIEAKRQRVADLLKSAEGAGSLEEMKEKMGEAQKVLEDLGDEAQMAYEMKLKAFTHDPEGRLKWLLSKDPPKALEQWRR